MKNRRGIAILAAILFLVLARPLFGQDITTVAGTGVQGFSGDGGQAPNAELFAPAGVAVDASGNLFIADTNNCVVREVTESTGKIATVAGTPPSPTTPNCGSSGDGSAAKFAQWQLGPHPLLLTT